MDHLARDASDADNQLGGTLSQLERGETHSEALIALPGGETLCATLDTAQADALNLQPGEPITAHFNADKVIIATLL